MNGQTETLYERADCPALAPLAQAEMLVTKSSWEDFLGKEGLKRGWWRREEWAEAPGWEHQWPSRRLSQTWV